ncbi:iron-sulfur cluster assembly accessory protein [Candidatus Woesearchaeota archaeon]|nr:iron-sulfur cluster assembly accessory protein [Candidatus Woesearchaeota archaeon]
MPELTLTDRAIAKVKNYIAATALETKQPSESYRLRIRIQGGGCSGFSYMLGVDNSVNDKTDIIIPTGGLEVVVDKKSLLYVNGSIIDYFEDFMGSGFKITNPNATGSCGCGKSFNA